MNRRYFWSFVVLALCYHCGPSLKRIEEADVHFQTSKRLYNKGETIQSLAEAERAASLDPKNEEVQNYLGLLYAERAMNEKAKAHFLRAVKLKEDYSEAHNNLCAFLYNEKKYDDATEHCLKAIKNVTYVTPERAYNNLALIYEKKGDPENAVKMHQKALVHNKKFVFSLLYLGKDSYEKKHYEKAAEYLVSADEACIASPKGSWGVSCPEAQYHLALTYLQLKQTPSAITAFENCRNNDPADEFKKKCEKSLRLYQR